MNTLNYNSQESLKKYIERIEHLEEEKKSISSDIKEVYLASKAEGFDTSIMKKIVAMRRKDSQQIEEEQSLIDVYMHAIS